MNAITHHTRSVDNGHRSPDFSLPSVAGQTVTLGDVLGAGPVVVWYANANGAARLKQLQKLGHQLDDRGARVVVISPNSPADTTRLADDVGGDFTFLADADRTVARDFGVRRTDGVHASAFVLDRSGTVRWHFVATGTTRQPRASTVLRAVTRSLGVPIAGPVSMAPVVIFALAVLAALAALARFADQALLSWDRPIRDAIRAVRGSYFHTFMRVTTHLGDRYGLVPLTLVLAVAVRRRCRQMAAALLTALLLGLALEYLIKAAVARPRPSGAVGFNSSFPSGHVVAGATFWWLVPPAAFILTARLWAWRSSIVTTTLIVAGIGVSRVYLGKHWPSDAVGSFLVGALVVVVMERFLRSPVFECDGCPLHPLRYGRRHTKGHTPAWRHHVPEASGRRLAPDDEVHTASPQP